MTNKTDPLDEIKLFTKIHNILETFRARLDIIGEHLDTHDEHLKVHKEWLDLHEGAIRRIDARIDALKDSTNGD